MAQHDVLVPVPQVVIDVEQAHVLRHADDVDEAVDLAVEGGLRLAEQPLHVLSVGGVARPGRTTDLGGDVGGQVGVEVDRHELGPHRCQCVAGLAADALAGTKDDEALAVQPQPGGVVGDLGVVGARHGPG